MVHRGAKRRNSQMCKIYIYLASSLDSEAFRHLFDIINPATPKKPVYFWHPYSRGRGQFITPRKLANLTFQVSFPTYV